MKVLAVGYLYKAVYNGVPTIIFICMLFIAALNFIQVKTLIAVL